MPTPVLEIAICPMGGRTITDESTEDGKMWLEIFSHVTNIPGFIRVGWGLNMYNRDFNLFCVDWESYPHHKRFMEHQGTLSMPIMDLMEGRPFDMYHIQTTTQRRDYLYAPITLMSFYINPDMEHFDTPSKKVFDLIERAVGCTGMAYGQAKNPPRADPQGWMAQGEVVVLMSGWTSEEAMEAALKSEAIASATKDVVKLVKKVVSYPVSFTVVDKSRWEQKWRRLPEPTLKDIPL